MALHTLPPIPANISPSMRLLVDQYLEGAKGQDEARSARWDGDAHELGLFPAITMANLAAKLLIAIHYAHPNFAEGGHLAVDPADFEATTAGSMLLQCLCDAMRLADGGAA